MKAISSVLCALAALHTLHAAPGDPDLSFGIGGKVTLQFPGLSSEGSAIASYPDGKIIVAGMVNGQFVALRLNQNGSLDTTFHGTGNVSSSFAGTSYCTGMAVGTSGQIILSGSTTQGGGGSGLSGFDEDGFTIFNTVTPAAGNGEAVAIQPNGKAVVVGNNGAGFTVCRYDASGVLDPTFDGDGKTGFALGYGSSASSVTVQSDGKIVLVGREAISVNSTDFLVMRLNSNGSLDDSFGGTGYVTTPVGTSAAYASSVSVVSGNKILVAGYINAPEPDAADFALVRYNTNGSLDSGFNGTGKVTANIGKFDTWPRLAIQNDGKYLIGGNSGLLRFNTDGSFDSTFSGDGKVPTEDSILGLAIQPNGRILSVSNGGGIIVSRFHDGFPLSLGIEQPAGTNLSSGTAQAIDFGTVIPGQNGRLTFTLRNRGTTDNLTGLAVTKAATGTPGDFVVSALGTTTLAPGADTTFTVTFTPTASGTRTARLEIASNDPDHNPFVLLLTGWGATNSDIWRKQHFGSYDNTGPGEDTNDPDKDGAPNLLEFATGTDPLTATPAIGQLAKTASGLEFTYSRPKVALGEVRYEVESSSTMSGAWIKTGTESIPSEDSIMQQVKVTTSAGSFGKRFVRLRVSRK